MNQAQQAKAAKVRRLIIDPMVRYYGLKGLPDGVIDAYTEDLGGYSEEQLGQAWREVRQTSKGQPRIAHFLDALRELTPRKQAAPAAPRYAQRNERLADEVMRSPLGQLAIRHGVAAGIWMLAWRDGRADLKEADVYRERDSLRDSADRIVKLKPNAPMTGAIKSFFESMQARETELATKYRA